MAPVATSEWGNEPPGKVPSAHAGTARRSGLANCGRPLAGTWTLTYRVRVRGGRQEIRILYRPWWVRGLGAARKKEVLRSHEGLLACVSYGLPCLFEWVDS